MGLEVALLESDPERGVQILGRTNKPDLVSLIRDHLIDRLDCNEPSRDPLGLRVVPGPGSEASAENEPAVESGIKPDRPSPTNHT